MQDNMEMVEMMREEMYTEPLGFDVIDAKSNHNSNRYFYC